MESMDEHRAGREGGGASSKELTFAEARLEWSGSAQREVFFQTSGRKKPDDLRGASDPYLLLLMKGVSDFLLSFTGGSVEWARELYSELVSGCVSVRDVTGQAFSLPPFSSNVLWNAFIRKTAWRDLYGVRLFSEEGRRLVWMACLMNAFGTKRLLYEVGAARLEGCTDENGIESKTMVLTEAALEIRTRLRRFDPTGWRTFRPALLLARRARVLAP